MHNIYLPQRVKIEKIEIHSPDARLFRFKKIKGRFTRNKDGLIFTPGQFVLLGLWGYGESAFGPCSSPEESSYMEVVIRNTGGNITGAFHKLEKGDEITLRGPYGNGFPIDFFKSKDVVMVTGGCGIPPIAGLIEYIIKHRKDFGVVYLVYGARAPQDLLLKDKIEKWRDQVDVVFTIDKPVQNWNGHVGLVSEFVKEAKINPANAVAAMCGPGPMMDALEAILNSLGIPDRRIFVSEERKMQCGVGKCQHCVTGDQYVCLDGPVFYYDQIDKNWN